jgi:hypothetical protein
MFIVPYKLFASWRVVRRQPLQLAASIAPFPPVPSLRTFVGLPAAAVKEVSRTIADLELFGYDGRGPILLI